MFSRSTPPQDFLGRFAPNKQPIVGCSFADSRAFNVFCHNNLLKTSFIRYLITSRQARATTSDSRTPRLRSL